MGKSDAGGESQGRRATAVRRTREQVVSAVRERLVRSGYNHLGLERVADDAGVTRVTIYRHFGSKAGLMTAVADDLAARSRAVERFAAVAAIADASAAFRGMVGESCRLWSTDPPLLRRMVALGAVDPEVAGVRESRERWRRDQIATIVHRLDGDGRIRPPFTADQAVASIGAVTSFAACDQLAATLGVDFSSLPEMLLAVLASVVHLDPA